MGLRYSFDLPDMNDSPKWTKPKVNHPKEVCEEFPVEEIPYLRKIELLKLKLLLMADNPKFDPDAAMKNGSLNFYLKEKGIELWD
jgi:hypothetical protein